MKLHLVFQIVFGHGADWSDPARLDRELAYLTEITLPSLAAQTETNFRLLMLCDAAHDEETRNRIRHAVWAQLDQRRAKVIFRGKGDAEALLIRSTNGRWDDRPYRVQVALDHDAAVASDYVARMRAAAATRAKKLKGPDDYRLIAFSAHYSLRLGAGDAQLYEKHSERGEPGLALVSHHGHDLSPLALRGKPIGAEHPIDLIGGTKPFVLSFLSPRAIRVPRRLCHQRDERALADAARRFAWLARAIDSLPERHRLH